MKSKKRNDYMKFKLVTTETFGTVPYDLYRNMNDNILLIGEQIG